MLTKKESLLVRPFVLKKYENHRRKVVEAEPVIDIHMPIRYPHVTVKQKKIQREHERLDEIERENQRLLTKLGQIMSKNRMENYWKEPRPFFANRVIIENLPNPRLKSAVARPSTCIMRSACSSAVSSSSMATSSSGVPSSRIRHTFSSRGGGSGGGGGRSTRCVVCNNTYTERVMPIPEERVPWAPISKSCSAVSRKPVQRNHKCCKFCC